MVVRPINAVHLFHVVYLPMVYRRRLLVGHDFEMLIKIPLRDHVDRGDELTTVVVGPIGTYWPCAWLDIDCAEAWGEGGIPGCKLGEFDILASWWFMRERIAARQSDNAMTCNVRNSGWVMCLGFLDLEQGHWGFTHGYRACKAGYRVP
jgi:hypothetical protein